MKKLAIITTHPIQYNAPLFRMLAERGKLAIRVYYTWSQTASGVRDRDFQRDIRWDIPLLEGYDYEFVPNIAWKPDSQRYFGVITPELIPRIENWRPDALLVYSWNTRSHFQAMRHFHGRIPVLFRGDSTLLDDRPGPRTWLRRLILRWVYRYIDYALYVGKHNHDYFKNCGLREDQLVYAPHAIDNTRFMANDEVRMEEARQWRRRLGIADGHCVFLFAGKLSLKKAPMLLLEAFLQLGRPEAHLVFVGDGQMEKALRDRAAQFWQVHFLGFQNQQAMPVIYRLADYLVLPSRGPGETWGLAVNEAMACGVPAIVSDRAGCSADIIKPELTGYIFQSDNQTDLQDKLLKAWNRFRSNRIVRKEIFEWIQGWSYQHICEAIE